MRFYDDVISSLSVFPKQLSSKYFYDAIGDKLFQEIMNCNDYYLTKCEMEILELQTKAIIDAISKDDYFELVELGPGDGTKSIKLLKEIARQKADFTYIPIDISHSIIDNLEVLVSDTRSCKSYLICLEDLDVHFPETVVPFKKDEYIHMEISQKFTLSQIEEMAQETGFELDRNFSDSKKWYVDSLWEAV